MIPAFHAEGFLPPGRHRADWSEFMARYGYNEHRRYLIKGLHQMVNLLGFASCREVRVGGSFVTSKAVPGDFDAVWMKDGVDGHKLPLEIEVAEFALEVQKDIFAGTIVSSTASFFDIGGKLFVEALETNRRQQPVGVVVLDPVQVPLAEPFPRYAEFFARAMA
jgi:hypothetical protein